MTLSAALVIFLGSWLPRAAQEPTGEEKKPALTIQSATADRVTVHYLKIPWGPNTFAAMQKGGDSFYARRTWPFARLELKAPVSLEGKKIPAGNYALVLHPNTPDDQGMSLEVLKIRVAEFLEAGNVMTPTPSGESQWRGPVRFDLTALTSPHLTIELAPGKAGVSLIVQYGDNRLVKELAF
ncbi:MAG TPA: hypothetical protein VN461_19965 [Vicinamibacteria bacterium]|jgi:hypothetical protein|nr:hypothetical protein [Vicinamibacteria bacterium]